MQSWLLFYNAIRYSVSQQLNTYLNQLQCWLDVYINLHALQCASAFMIKFSISGIFISTLDCSPEGNPVCLPFLMILYHNVPNPWSLPRRHSLLILIFDFYVFIGHFFAVFMWAFFRRMRVFPETLNWHTKTARSACSCKPRCAHLYTKL